jgi:hypothetical protein
MQIAKTIEGAIVQISKFAETVEFSTDKGWFCICTDFYKPAHKRFEFKWVPASTQFIWTREQIT